MRTGHGSPCTSATQSDTRRVLHGRAAFDPSTGRRHLQGCYVDRDQLLSRIRVLERQAPPQ